MVEKLTRKQAAIIGAYTGITCGPFVDIHKYVDSLPGLKGVMTHNFANENICEIIRNESKADFLAICPTSVDL